MFVGDDFFEAMLFNNFVKSLLASKQINKPNNKIDKIKIFWWLKIIKINNDNRIIDVNNNKK